MPKECENLQDAGPKCEPQFSTRRIFIMGGRAQSATSIPDGWDRVHGGIVPPKGSRKREMTVLMNDIWSTTATDKGAGDSWFLEQPGCIVPQHDQILYNGRQANYCEDDDDCVLNSKCDLAKKTCVCQMWSPRERHATTAFQGRLYVMGGVTYRDVQACERRRRTKKAPRGT